MSYEIKNLKKVELANGRVGISFFYDNKRYRFFNGKAIDADFQPNTCKSNLKDKQLEMMLQAFAEKLAKGWRPTKVMKPKVIQPIDINLLKAITLSFEQKMKMEYKKGGKKSGEVRAERKKLKDALIALLGAKNPETGNVFQDDVILALMKKALNGDVTAFNSLRDTV
jgi:hypothetical protein